MSDTVLKLLKEDGTLHTSKRFRALHDGMLDLTGCSNRMFKQQEVSLVRDSRHAQQLPMLSALGKATGRFISPSEVDLAEGAMGGQKGWRAHGMALRDFEVLSENLRQHFNEQRRSSSKSGRCFR